MTDVQQPVPSASTDLVVDPALHRPDLLFAPIALRARSDGWTPDRQRAFVEELADCGVIREAARRVGMSERSVARLRRRPGSQSFAAACEAALVIGTQRLRSIAFDRAVNGYVKRHYYHGELKSEERVFDHRLLIFLLGKTGLIGDPAGRVARFEQAWPVMIDALRDDAGSVAATAPDLERTEVFRLEGKMWTRFPPPTGFRGTEKGGFGDDDYCRTLSHAEQAALKSLGDEEIGVRRADAERRRDHYFGFEPGCAAGGHISAP